MDKASKKKPKASKGLVDRMESFYFEMTSPDGQTVKIGSQQESPRSK